MLTHLGEEELIGLMAGRDDEIAMTGHLEICPDCRERMQACRQELLSFREKIDSGLQRPAAYWEAQRRIISTRLRGLSPLSGTWGLGWTVACYGLALSVLLLAIVNFQQTKTVLRPTPQISDAALLTDVEARINEDVPEALQPAGLLVSEMGDADRRPNQVKTHKTSRTLQ